ncbi:glycosyltransferase family 4 protein [Rhizobium sp. SSA_523]|uniref:glycosyltransferase family 4 protein n=1 Tax=Rhizobium sp. SSA_523 TaxID=2952477 RepID=UPI0020903E81|nr:glycosyltransferase family 4 protein [Rhizobium sp. SSA_523]MCO5733268.1 glycosyltransferase family 4 protein [Rhizobium sp. SSA_523]WKC21746.1 glycosyltransferase family 4 protein [Rhizobium sp. SSA_523]
MNQILRPRRILMTVDAVGGVWRYAMDLARGLAKQRMEIVFAGFGPAPDATKRREAEAIGKLVWLPAPLDWMADGEADAQRAGAQIAELAAGEKVDLLHLNLPSQAASLALDIPVLTVSHSCVVTWFACMRGGKVPEAWSWQKTLNAQGLARADIVVVPSRSHGVMLEEAYGPQPHLAVVHNATRLSPEWPRKQNFVFAAGRWWDDGKNGRTLDEAAEHASWPILMAGPTHGPSGQQVALLAATGLGELSHSEAMNHLVRAGIFVSPSLYEPFGLAALEAARLGAALVLSDIPTYRELWDGAALFADPHEPQEFADQINRLAADERLRSDLARQAQTASKAFTLDRQVHGMAELYAQATGRHSAQAAAE